MTRYSAAYSIVKTEEETLAAGEDEAVRREFARGTLELAILSVLRKGRRYGYELIATLADATDGILEVKEGTVYPMLHRLEDAGHISSHWEAEGRAVPRKYYTLSPTGRARLKLLTREWERVVGGMSQLLGGEES